MGVARLALLAGSIASAGCGRVRFDSVVDASTGDGATGSIALVQQASGQVFAMTALAITLPGPTQPGDLVVFCGGSYDRPLVGITGAGTTWIKAVSEYTTDNIEIWYGIVTGPGTSTVSLDGTGTSRSLWGHVSEWSGIAATSTLDAVATGQGQTEMVATLSISPADSDELLYFCLANIQDTVYGVPGPDTWSSLAHVGATNVEQAEWFQIAPAPGLIGVSVTQDQIYWDAAAASFEPLR